MDASRATAAGPVGGADGPPAVLKGRFEIAQDALSDPIASPRAQAHAARDRLNDDHEIFALICDPELPPNLAALKRLREHPSRALLRLLDHGVVPWSETGDHRLALIYERPQGPRLVPSLSSPFEPLPEQDIINRVMAPVVSALDELEQMDVTHGAVRPTNLFMPRDKGSLAMLGENASAPAHFHQPVSFASIELGQAWPAGRGAGSIADDIYALAVTVLTLIYGEDPAGGRDDASLLAEKIERGSFAALTGHRRLPAVLREPLRGMLDDRTEQRWTLADLSAWLSDRRLKTPGHLQSDRAQRTLTLGGIQFHHTRPLSHHIATGWDRLRLEEKGHEILTWARRGLGDDSVGDAVLMAMEQSERNAQGGDGTINPAFAARLAMALDRRAPVRYRGVCAHLDGFGPLLAVHGGETESVRAIGEAMVGDLAQFRHRSTNDDGRERGPLMRVHSLMTRYLKNPGIGYGIERCLYELNPLQYCRSPLVAKYKVMQIEDLLPALEKISGGGAKGPPFDRHIAAFVAARLRVELQSMLTMASDPKDPERAALGMLGVLGTLQAQMGRKAYPGLTRWIGDYLQPVVESFRHRMWREKVENELPALIDRGDVTALYIYLSNGEVRQRDRNGYANAVAEYARLSTEISFLKSFGFNDPRRTEEYGRQISCGLTGLLSAVAMILSFVLAWQA